MGCGLWECGQLDPVKALSTLFDNSLFIQVVSGHLLQDVSLLVLCVSVVLSVDLGLIDGLGLV